MTKPPSVVLSYGLGVDSTAILLRWINDQASRDFELSDLVVVTAMTGDEWEQTGRDVEAHVLPLMRRHGIRFVQVARAQRYVTKDGGGVAVLDDSTSPTRLHLGGRYRLSDEMRAAGTVPQTGGARLCSVHAKGDALDPIIARITQGRPYRHVVGFECNEPSRAAKDATYNTATRTGVYPLVEWGWNRARCEEYIAEHTGGIAWEKSACVFCPFALANRAGRERVLARYAETPAAGVETLMLEHRALALNPTQGLVGGKRAVDYVRAAGPGHRHVLDAFTEALDAAEHAVYEVRRVLTPTSTGGTQYARSVRTLATGTRAAMLALVDAQQPETGDDGIARAHLRRRGATLPTGEHFLVAAPAGVADKDNPAFARRWDALPEYDPADAAAQQLALL